MTKPIVFNYLDYRKYLKDYYDYMKVTSPKFSYRSFARIANLKSENYLKLVIDGKAPLTKNYRGKFSKGCSLSKNEKEYFYTLIEFNDTKEISEKNRLFKRLGRQSKKSIQKQISADQFRLLSKWYYMVVRSLVGLNGFDPDPNKISKKLRSLITPKQAEEALTLLLELGLIKKIKGKYMLSDKHITTREEIKRTATRNFHSQMIPIGIKALEINPINEREIRAITIGVSTETAQKAMKQIECFYKELVSYLKHEDENNIPEEVWQLNVQFFKFTK
jgi:uncharacterized protein (TIGR02147 family)